ncbi:hypothetical protein V6N11_061614 [Hibiscus sabdariffa]|uniref:RNase H type-1 domain-containing protein n=1 Tax=Hibiscus sabdariffa TaxID=183260 RepID=A0ABR2A3P7_9ROSI
MQVVVSGTLQAVDRVALLVMAELYDGLQQAWEGGYQMVLLECESMTTYKLLVDEAGENRDLGVHATDCMNPRSELLDVLHEDAAEKWWYQAKGFLLLLFKTFSE